MSSGTNGGTRAPISAIVVARLPILLFIALGRFARDRVAASEPTTEVDIGAMFRTEGPESLDRQLGADWTGPQTGRAGGLGGTGLGDRGHGSLASNAVQPQEMCRETFPDKQRQRFIERQPYNTAVGAHELHHKSTG